MKKKGKKKVVLYACFVILDLANAVYEQRMVSLVNLSDTSTRKQKKMIMIITNK